jgi:hypothetical protein
MDLRNDVGIEANASGPPARCTIVSSLRNAWSRSSVESTGVTLLKNTRHSPFRLAPL